MIQVIAKVRNRLTNFICSKEELNILIKYWIKECTPFEIIKVIEHNEIHT